MEMTLVATVKILSWDYLGRTEENVIRISALWFFASKYAVTFLLSEWGVTLSLSLNPFHNECTKSQREISSNKRKGKVGFPAAETN
jgi:hypothetical protein